MKTTFLFLIITFSSITSFSQKVSDAAFNKRLDKYMQLTRELNFEELMNYTHPKLFTLAPREQLIELFKKVYDNEQMSMGFDSTAILHVSDNFQFENALYKKIDYWASIAVTLKDTAALSDEAFISTMKMSFEKAFPGGSVEFIESQKKFQIKTSSIMVAIKDNAKTPWMFLGYQKDANLLKSLYPQKVIEHFKLL